MCLLQNMLFTSANIKIFFLPNFSVCEWLCFDRDDVWILLLAFGNFSFVRRHVELRRPLSANDGESLLDGRLVAVAHAAVVILGLDVEDVLHVKLERLLAAGSNHAGSLVDLKTPTGWKKEGKLFNIPNINTQLQLLSCFFEQIYGCTYSVWKETDKLLFHVPINTLFLLFHFIT